MKNKKEETKKISKRMRMIGLGLIIIGLAVLGLLAYLNNQQPSLTQNLPAKPSDFVNMKHRLEVGQLNDVCIFTDNYFLQPDFYPTWDDTYNLFYEHHDYSRWGVHGYGVYPALQGITLSNFKQGESFPICAFLKTAGGVETWQGVKLVPIENEYFKIEILNQDYENYPNHFLLEPTFPEFSKNWAKKLEIKVTAKQNVPAGKYIIGFNIVRPDDRFNKEKYNEIMGITDEYDKSYYESCIKSLSEKDIYADVSEVCNRYFQERQRLYVAGGTWQIGQQFFTLEVQVTE